MMMSTRGSSVQRVQDDLKSRGLDTSVVELPDSTRTAEQAAAAVGTEVGQIVKSLVFCTQTSRNPVLVLTSGANQVNEDLLESQVGEPVQFARADFVRQTTGFAIGGVSPFGLLQPILVFIDRDLLQHPEIWAAAGSPRAVFRIRPQELVDATAGKVIQVC